ncbi:hypothetical protein BLJAPNOD_04674 [Ensifer sp. M14]|uniref:Abi family protein n=1 Tax=Ensifer sp. M14 TaxID=2203782 RepID=UPI000E1E0B7A|nr:Abi family protein [Ensifer sp. M14]RDL48399.1 hypothetical protein BLJAPNOD_04674 [Ensifer sp. M14]
MSGTAENKGGPSPVSAAPISVSTGDLPREAVIKKPNSACTSYTALDSVLQDETKINVRSFEVSRKAISPARLSRYLRIAEGDLRVAIRLHAWNAAVAASLLPTVHHAEVAIRNFAVSRLRAKYGAQWYRNPALLQYRLSKSLSQQLADVYQREIDIGRRGELTNYITSELTFGFWVNVFTKTFHLDLWQPAIYTMLVDFPRGKTITDLHDGVEFVRSFRNNIAHHKNIVCKPAEANYERTLEVLGMICKHTRNVAEKTSNFRAVWECSPVPHEKLSII